MYGGAPPGMPPAPGMNGPPLNGPPPPMQYRTSSPRPDGRMPSPKSAYPQHPPYPSHHDPGHQSAMESGAPPPQAAMTAEALHREHERPSSVGPKRLREWEDDSSSKKPASDENRARLEDMRHRRPSTPPREPYRRNSSEARRFEEQRRMEDQRRAEDQRRVEEMRRGEERERHPIEGYHPSEAAHHPPSHSMPNHLPPMQQGPSPMQNLIHDGPPPPGPAPKDYPPEDRQRMEHPPPPHPPVLNEPERAARTMEVDENYDDSGDEKKTATVNGAGSGSGPGSSTGDTKMTTPTSASINGIMGPKVEAT